jgi:hypothetical protein
MDASLLMSSNYTPPLVGSELPLLVHHLFDPENISWLKHAAARKFLSWRDRQLSSAIVELSSSSESKNPSLSRQVRPAGDPVKLAHRKNPPERLLLSRHALLSTDTEGVSKTSMSYLSPHEIHLQNTVLDNIPKRDRARWLLERLHEEVVDGNIGVLYNEEQSLADRRISYLGGTPAMRSGLPLDKEQSNRCESGLSMSFTRQKDYRSLKHPIGLPSWARRRHYRKEMDPNDPLGLYDVWEGWGRAIVCGVGGGLAAGVVWVVVLRGWPWVWGE